MQRRCALGLFPLWGLVVSTGCGHGARRVEFQGLADDPKVTPAAVTEAPAVPRSATRLGRLTVRCESIAAGESFHERSLVDVDCGEPRLRQLLRHAAAERGGDVLAEVECDADGGARCRATLARSSEDTLPMASDRIPPPAEIWVSFEAHVAAFRRPSRGRDEVRELTELGPTQVEVGELETSCDGCEERALREALLVSAGRLGISDVVGVHCSDGEETRCEAVAAVSESEER